MPTLRGLLRLTPTALVTSERRTKKSLKWIRRPWPRPYRRRVYEEALKPIISDKPQVFNQERLIGYEYLQQRMAMRCPLRAERREAIRAAQSKLSEMDIAHVKHMREDILAQYRVMAICQRLDERDASERDHWDIRTRMMNKCNLKLWRVSERIMKHVVDNTRWANLLPLFDGCTALVLAQRIEDIPTIVKEVDKTNFLELLAIACDNRILSALEAKSFARYPDSEMHAVDTVNLLQKSPVEMTRLLNSHAERLSFLLQSRMEQLRVNEKPSE